MVAKTAEPEQRAATGRVITGKDCEYIKLCSITANSGCTNGEDEDTDQNDVDAVVSFESFRALKLTLFESFRVLKYYDPI